MLLVFYSHIEGQNQQDYVWLFGHNSRDTEGIESFRFDFNNGSSPDSIRGLLPIEFSQFNTSISDKNSNLLYYSNGCAIVGSDHEVLPNGYEINEGDWVDVRIDSCDRYPGFQDGLFLEAPSRNDQFYLIHQKFILDEPRSFKVLNFTLLDQSLNRGIGDVTLKNQLVIDSTQYTSSYLTAIRHINQNDWWILQPVRNTPDIEIIQLRDSGFSRENTYSLPFSFSI